MKWFFSQVTVALIIPKRRNWSHAKVRSKKSMLLPISTVTKSDAEEIKESNVRRERFVEQTKVNGFRGNGHMLGELQKRKWKLIH